MSDPTFAEVFRQEDYNSITSSLDAVMDRMMSFGNTEEEARAWLLMFITVHYFPVWRAMSPVLGVPRSRCKSGRHWLLARAGTDKARYTGKPVSGATISRG